MSVRPRRLYSYYLRSAVVLTALSACAGAQAQVYDAVANFSTSSNSGVNGVWSYGQKNTTGGAFSLLNNSITSFASKSGINGWGGSQSFGSPSYPYPFILKNFNATTTTYASVSHPTDLLNIHPFRTGTNPNFTNYYGVVRWTAPKAGRVSLEGLFKDLDTTANGATTDVHIVFTTGATPTTIFTTNIVNNKTITFGQGQVVSAGDTIDFMVGPGTNGFTFDSTGFKAAVVFVPEPSTLALTAGALGFLPLALRRRRK